MKFRITLEFPIPKELADAPEELRKGFLEEPDFVSTLFEGPFEIIHLEISPEEKEGK